MKHPTSSYAHPTSYTSSEAYQPEHLLGDIELLVKPECLAEMQRARDGILTGLEYQMRNIDFELAMFCYLQFFCITTAYVYVHGYFCLCFKKLNMHMSL